MSDHDRCSFSNTSLRGWLARIHPPLGLAELTWVSLLLVIPLAGDAPRDAGLLDRLLSLPALLELGLVLLAALAVLRVARKDVKAFLNLLRSRWLLPLIAYACYGLVSSVFSPYRLPALAYTFQALVATLLSAAVFGGSEGVGRRPNLRPLLIAVGVTCVLVETAWAVSPATAWRIDAQGDARLTGMGLHPNQLGYQASVLGLLAVGRGTQAGSWRQRAASAALLLIALPVLVGTRSRADTLGLLAGVFVLLAFGRRWRWIAALLASGLVSLVLAPGLTTRFLAYLNRGPELPELAGRLAVWEHVLQHSLSSPKTALLGQGIGTSALVLRRAVERWAFPAHAHNLLLEALNNAGLPGVLLVLSSLVFVAHGAWAIARRVPAAPDGRAALLALFTLTLLVSAVEHTFAGRANVYAFGYWAVAASCHAGLSGPARSDSGGRAAHAS